MARRRDYTWDGERVKGCENTSFVGLSGVDAGLLQVDSFLPAKREQESLVINQEQTIHVRTPPIAQLHQRPAAIPRSLEHIISLLR